MKRGIKRSSALLVFILLIVLIISLSFVSADIFTDIWKKITGRAITGEAVVTNGLIAEYKFEGNVNDNSGNLNHGTQNGNPTYINGISGQALNFDGVDDYVSLPNLGIFGTGMTDGSFSAWVKLNVSGCVDGGGKKHQIFQAYAGSSNYLDFIYDGTSNQRWQELIKGSSLTNRVILDCSNESDLESWNHFVMTWTTAGNINLYKNSILIGSDSTNSLSFSGTSSYRIGMSTGGKNLNGLIDEV